jgi:hypothetical protein
MVNIGTPSTTSRRSAVEAEYSVRREGTEEVQVVVLNGDEIVLRENAQTKFDEILTLHKKGDRALMDKKDRLALIAAATEKQDGTLFSPLSLTVSDETKLDDCYNIAKKVEKVEARHRTYDMHDVFNIVVPSEEDRKRLKPEVYNLYTDYASVTPEMVAQSNTWYNTWPEGPTWRENLTWTHRFFENNTTAELAEKVNETYMEFAQEARGGPLYFIILINQILSQTEDAVLALQLRLKKLDLRNIPGENVDKAISLARAAIIRLETFNKVPEDLVRNLLKVFQTSSVGSFNEIFKHMEQQRYLTQALYMDSRKDQLTAGGIFRVAATQYRLMWEEGTWTGVRLKGGTDAIFANAANGKGCCWNCGSTEHRIGECKVPKDRARIEANKNAMFKAQPQGGNSKSGKREDGKGKKPAEGKYRPPSADENNRRVIDGKPMFWRELKKRWVPDRDAKRNASANVAAPSSGSSTTSTTTTATTSSTGTTNVSSVNLTARRAFANAYSTAWNQFPTSI